MSGEHRDCFIRDHMCPTGCSVSWTAIPTMRGYRFHNANSDYWHVSYTNCNWLQCHLSCASQLIRLRIVWLSVAQLRCWYTCFARAASTHGAKWVVCSMEKEDKKLLFIDRKRKPASFKICKTVYCSDEPLG